MTTRVINIGVVLISVPLTISYLGQERFGLWMALTGFLSLLTFSDFGLGIGLQNALSECHGKDDRERPAAYVTAALMMIFGVLCILTCIALWVLPLVPLDQLIKLKSSVAQRELLPTAQVMIVAFGFGLSAGLLQKIYLAYQEGYYAQIWLMLGRIAALGGIIVCVWFKLGLPALAGTFAALPFVVQLLGSMHIFARRSWLIPSLRKVRPWALRRVFHTGTAAMFAQVSNTAITGGIPLIIANRIGAEAVTPFAVTQRLLGIPIILCIAILSPLWPAYREAIARGETAWVRKTFRRTVYVAAALVLPALAILIPAGRSIIRVWTGQAFSVPSWSLLLACSVLSLCTALMVVLGTALSGMDRLKGQAIYGSVFSMAALVAGYYVAGRWGVAATVWTVVLIGILLRCVAARIELGGVFAQMPATPEGGLRNCYQETGVSNK